MILVNNAGACGFAYAPLRHAKRWNMYIDAVVLAADTNSEFNQAELDKKIKIFED